MNTEVRATPAPQRKETLHRYEKLLGEATTGGQTLLLLGLEPPKPDAIVATVQIEQLRTNAIEGIPEDHKKRLTNASFNERDEYWKDTPEAERMQKWRKSTNEFLDQYTKDQAKTAEQEFLKRILKTDTPGDINADALYSTFMQGEGKGDVEYFARRIADTNTPQEIAQNQSLIEGLGKIYGAASAKIAELLSYGVTNARHNLDRFVSSAQETLNKRAYGENVWTPLAANAAQWEKKQQARQQKPMEPTQLVAQAPQPSQPELPGTATEYHPLVADAADESQKDLNKSVPNQDARFVDRKHAAFGIFDGLGGNIQGEIASSTASKYIEEALASLPASLLLEETEEAVKTAIINASKKLWEINELCLSG